MTFNTREILIFAGSAIAILAGTVNIATGAAGTGLYISIFVVLMFIIVIVAALNK